MFEAGPPCTVWIDHVIRHGKWRSMRRIQITSRSVFLTPMGHRVIPENMETEQQVRNMLQTSCKNSSMTTTIIASPMLARSLSTRTQPSDAPHLLEGSSDFGSYSVSAVFGHGLIQLGSSHVPRPFEKTHPKPEIRSMSVVKRVSKHRDKHSPRFFPLICVRSSAERTTGNGYINYQLTNKPTDSRVQILNMRTAGSQHFPACWCSGNTLQGAQIQAVENENEL